MASHKGTFAPDCRQCRKLLRELKALTVSVGAFLDRLDDEMGTPSSPERGKRIAALCNSLEMGNDHVRYFTLGIDYRRDGKNRRRKNINAEVTHA